MKTTIKKSFIIIMFVCELAAAIFLLYLYERPGFAGLIKWERKYLISYLEGVALLIIPALCICACIIFRKTFVKYICLILSVLTLCCSGFLVLRFSYFGNRVSKNHSEINNIISAGESLPARKSKKDSDVLLHVAFASDPHWGVASASNGARLSILNQVNKNNYDAFFILGDIGDRGDDFATYEEVCSDINMFVPSTPVRLLMGNHDAAVDASGRFRKYFYGRKTASLNYRIDGGDVHFIILNMLWGPEDFKSNNRKWLINQLKSIPHNDTVIILSHCFFISSGKFNKENNTKWYDIPSMSKYCDLFQKYKVDFVVSGHNHLIDLLQKDDVTYAVCGSMGGELEKEIDYVSPYDIWHKTNTFGFIDATIYRKNIDLIFYDDEGNIINNFTIDTRHHKTEAELKDNNKFID